MPEKKNKHLTISDRIEIEKGVAARESFANIARRIGVATSTVSRDVKQNGTVTAIDRRSFNLCARKGECSLSNVCGIVRPHLQKGWSFEAIWAAYGDSLPVSARTMYSYAERGILGLANLELPKKVKYKPRRRVRDYRVADRIGRGYSEFMGLPRAERENAVQMDCVMGKARGSKCILTLHFPKWELQLMVLLEEHSCRCVVGALDFVESVVGLERFRRLFGVILTDRGLEFADFEAIERSAYGPQRRCRVFYCDPMRSCQKGSCEKNHELIRHILPKGSDLDALSRHDVATVASHVNSYPWPSLGGRSPFAAASRKVPKALLDELGARWLRADEVCLKPEVLKRRK